MMTKAKRDSRPTDKSTSLLRPLTLADIPRLMLAFTFIYLAASDYSPAWMFEPEGGAKDLIAVGLGRDPGGVSGTGALQNSQSTHRFDLKHAIDLDPTLHQGHEIKVKPSTVRSS